jgi:hypothetical protein
VVNAWTASVVKWSDFLAADPEVMGLLHKVMLLICISCISDILQKPCYLSRADHDRKIRSRKQKTDVGKYSFVNSTVKLWNQLPADALGNLSHKPSNFRKKVRKVIHQVKRKHGASNKACSEVK